jgi:hypothetical protein
MDLLEWPIRVLLRGIHHDCRRCRRPAQKELTISLGGPLAGEECLHYRLFVGLEYVMDVPISFYPVPEFQHGFQEGGVELLNILIPVLRR